MINIHPTETSLLAKPVFLPLTQHNVDLFLHKPRYLGYARLGTDFVLVTTW